MVIIMVVLAGIEVIVAIASAVLAAMAQVYEVRTACAVIAERGGGGVVEISDCKNFHLRLVYSAPLSTDGVIHKNF